MYTDISLLRNTQRMDGKEGIVTIAQQVTGVERQREDGTYPYMKMGRTFSLLEQPASQLTAGSR